MVMPIGLPCVTHVSGLPLPSVEVFCHFAYHKLEIFSTLEVLQSLGLTILYPCCYTNAYGSMI